jgi:glycosyltransferase involved in cell wall biosynthesis
LGEVLGIPALLRCCDVGALVPVRNEGLSNTLLEYMAAGLPVLATDCGGNRELVREGMVGILMDVNSSVCDRVERWARLLTQQNEWKRDAIRSLAKIGHARHVVEDRYSEFYAVVFDGKRAVIDEREA